MEWPMQDAKKQLSKVVQAAKAVGPQTITVRGQRAAVILSAADYDRLLPNKPTLVDHLLSGPEWDDEFCEIVDARDKTPGPDMDL